VLRATSPGNANTLIAAGFSLVMGQKNQLWWDLPSRNHFSIHKESTALSRPVERRKNDAHDLLEVRKLVSQPVLSCRWASGCGWN